MLSHRGQGGLRIATHLAVLLAMASCHVTQRVSSVPESLNGEQTQSPLDPTSPSALSRTESLQRATVPRRRVSPREPIPEVTVAIADGVQFGVLFKWEWGAETSPETDVRWPRALPRSKTDPATLVFKAKSPPTDVVLQAFEDIRNEHQEPMNAAVVEFECGATPGNEQPPCDWKRMKSGFGLELRDVPAARTLLTVQAFWSFASSNSQSWGSWLFALDEG